MKLRPYKIWDGGMPTDEIGGYYHYCPACHEPHGIAVKQRNRSGARWSFNGDMERPTFAPSIKCFTIVEGKQHTLCHYFIRDGMIEFCNDNPHALNGQTVPLPDYPKSWG
jgi:Family of unknown function (DUF6527)